MACQRDQWTPGRLRAPLTALASIRGVGRGVEARQGGVGAVAHPYFLGNITPEPARKVKATQPKTR